MANNYQLLNNKCMKKTWTMAILAAGMMASCSSNGEEAPNVSEQEEAPVKMELSVGSLASVSVAEGRGIGTGAVGGELGQNKWAGEKFNLIAVGTDSKTLDAEGNPTKYVEINNEVVTAPIQVSEGDPSTIDFDTDANGTHYYVGANTYAFFAYHFGNADYADLGTVLSPSITTDGLAVDVTIDGTNDLMIATTNKEADITAQDSGNGTALWPDDENKLYSAWSARKGVTPTLNFQHLLTRLVFKAKMAQGEIADQISIKSIKLKNVTSKANVVIIPSEGTSDDAPRLTTNDADLGTTEFQLMERTAAGQTMTQLTPMLVTSTEEQVGESMLVIPGTQYEVAIELTEVLEDGTDHTSTITQTLQLADHATFEANNQYTVNIAVYGLQKIVVNASLTPWTNAGSIDVDPDDM